MKEQRIFNQAFAKELTGAGFNVPDIESVLAKNRSDKKPTSTIKMVKRWTGLPPKRIQEGLSNVARDDILPQIEQEAKKILEPWINNKVDQDLPTLQVIQLSRNTGVSPERIVDVLGRYPMTVDVNGSTFTSALQLPEFPKGKLTLRDSNRFGVSPRKVFKDALYYSRPRGGGAVQKARLQVIKNSDGIKDGNRIDPLIRREARKKAKIVFEPVQKTDNLTFSEFGVMDELQPSISRKPKPKKLEEIVFKEPNGWDLMRVIKTLKEIGFGKNWVLGDNEQELAESLAAFSRGEPTDFLIWNCIGFEWFASTDGQFPTCNITNNLDAAISLYFKDKIQKVAEILSSIGEPKISILVPSNEAFDENAWQYRQSYLERERIINDAVSGLRSGLADAPLPYSASVEVLRWDDYLQSRDAAKDPQYYSQEGEQRVRKSDKYEKIVREAIKSGRSYFSQNGITNISDETFALRQPRYYGVYAGEGVAFEELKKNGRNTIVINFEEMRVPQMAYLGSGLTLPIITPITEQEMVGYYRWEERKIKERKNE